MNAVPDDLTGVPNSSAGLGAVELVDPICGATVTEDSPHRLAHAGALFFFCSEECRARFSGGALRLPRLEAAVGLAAAEALAAPPAPGPNPSPRAFNLPAWLERWRERRFAAKCSRELLRTYRRIATRNPQLARSDLYREVVRSRTGADAAFVDSVLDFAEQSFAQWPVSRALSLRDIVHYLVVSEFVATHREIRWITADLKRVVRATIPSGL
jgi:YHS domain-containing protein